MILVLHLTPPKNITPSQHPPKHLLPSEWNSPFSCHNVGWIGIWSPNSGRTHLNYLNVSAYRILWKYLVTQTDKFWFSKWPSFHPAQFSYRPQYGRHGMVLGMCGGGRRRRRQLMTGGFKWWSAGQHEKWQFTILWCNLAGKSGIFPYSGRVWGWLVRQHSAHSTIRSNMWRPLNFLMKRKSNVSAFLGSFWFIPPEIVWSGFFLVIWFGHGLNKHNLSFTHIIKHPHNGMHCFCQATSTTTSSSSLFEKLVFSTTLNG